MAHDNWETPPALMNKIEQRFGVFDLDAAASAESAKCPRYITKEMDAFTVAWTGENVWCNPPYSMLQPFVREAYMQAHQQGNKVTLLIPAYTDTSYWYNYIRSGADEILFLTGRLRFWEEGRPGKDTARFPSVLVRFDGMRTRYAPLISPRINWWNWKWGPQHVDHVHQPNRVGRKLGR